MDAGDRAKAGLGVGAIRPGEPGMRRAVLLDPRPGRIRAFVEDDVHHFEVELAHRDGIITHVAARTIRHPWTTCTGAGPLLADRLCGVALADAAGFDSPYAHCTHLYDLALLAAAHARDARPTLFRMFVADAVAGRRRAVLERDSAILIDWPLDRETILPPHHQAGLSLRAIRQWGAALPVDEREAGLLLRRVVFISIARTFDPDTDIEIPNPPPGACFTHQPEHFDPEARMRGSRRDFTSADEGPLAPRIVEVARRD